MSHDSRMLSFSFVQTVAFRISRFPVPFAALISSDIVPLLAPNGDPNAEKGYQISDGVGATAFSAEGARVVSRDRSCIAVVCHFPFSSRMFPSNAPVAGRNRNAARRNRVVSSGRENDSIFLA